MKKKLQLILAVIILCFGIAWAAPTAMWDAPTTGGPVVGYRLYFYPQGDSTNKQMVDVGATTSYDVASIIVSLPYDTPYDMYVVAYNAAGEGGPSNIETIVRPLEVPGACSNFRVN